MRRSFHGIPRGAAALFLPWFAGCARPVPADRPTPPDACPALLAPAEPPDTVTVALMEPVDLRHAPDPRNATERLVFGHLHESLIRTDCGGRISPGLAESWKATRDGRVWDFTLRADARFRDGGPLTAVHIVEAWRAREVAGHPLAALLPWNGSESATPLNDRVLRVALREPRRTVPPELAHPLLALTAVSAEIQATGTRPDALDRSASERERAPVFVLMVHPTGRDPRPVLRLLPSAGADAHDLLDGDVDLLLSEDPWVLGYASRLSEFLLVPLAWDRTYVLLSPPFAFDRETDPDREPGPPLGERLAGGERRPAEPPFWWSELSCEPRSEPALPDIAAFVSPGRIVYPAEDRIARDLAERLVALARPRGATSDSRAPLDAELARLLGSGSGLTAVALPSEEFGEVLRSGRERAYVMALPRRTVAPCFEAGRLLAAAPWLTAMHRTPAEPWTPASLAPRASLEGVLIPLVDARRIAIVRRGTVGLILDAYGTVRLWTREERTSRRLAP